MCRGLSKYQVRMLEVLSRWGELTASRLSDCFFKDTDPDEEEFWNDSVLARQRRNEAKRAMASLERRGLVTLGTFCPIHWDGGPQIRRYHVTATITDAGRAIVEPVG